MPETNRREFLVCAAVAAAALTLPVLDSRADDSASSSASPAGTDVGPLKSFDTDGVKSHWAESGHFFVIRDSGKLYAPSSLCTHKSCVLSSEVTALSCECHHSKFALDGTVTQGPAHRSLPRHAISVDASGNVIVDTSKRFAEAHWNDPASFIALDGAKS